ncbi:phosphoglycerate kinase [Candidatus Uhrbacteria bacterium]|nr:phosphoglycerate kinase [Candidatus Uhrbacteria bacterium]
MPLPKIEYIDTVEIKNKKVLLRVDFNVSLDASSAIADDTRIQQSLGTINHLLKNNNRLIIISHLGRPEGRDKKYSLKVVADKLQQYLPAHSVRLVNDFLTELVFDKGSEGAKMSLKEYPKDQAIDEVLLLENIRFYNEEKQNDPDFARKLASLAQVYVNDAFGVSHRTDASVVGVPHYLPSYGGLLLKKEVEMIGKLLEQPEKPFVAIIGGAKIATKIALIGKLLELADYLLIGGGLANTFLAAQGYEVGKSFCEYERIEHARRLLFTAAQKNTAVILPSDVAVGDPKDTENGSQIKHITQLEKQDQILDLGPESQAKYGALISKAKTIVWNGPIGYFENQQYRRGTDFIYYAITENTEATSVVGGGDTLAAISKKEYLDKITHISTGGAAMLEFMEKGNLPGIDAISKIGG